MIPPKIPKNTSKLNTEKERAIAFSLATPNPPSSPTKLPSRIPIPLIDTGTKSRTVTTPKTQHQSIKATSIPSPFAKRAVAVIHNN